MLLSWIWDFFFFLNPFYYHIHEKYYTFFDLIWNSYSYSWTFSFQGHEQQSTHWSHTHYTGFSQSVVSPLILILYLSLPTKYTFKTFSSDPKRILIFMDSFRLESCLTINWMDLFLFYQLHWLNCKWNGPFVESFTSLGTLLHTYLNS